MRLATTLEEMVVAPSALAAVSLEAAAAPLLLSLHALATLFMTGLIWFVQVVHYPLFRRVGAAEFCAYERAHQARTMLIVGPMMLLEAGAAVALPFVLQGEAERGMAWAGLALLAVIWVSTALVQGPAHQRLSPGFDERLWRLLVTSNWLRTAAWSGRSLIALGLLATA